jgi:hypothetical protein
MGTCAIITIEANNLIKSYHDRMPVIIKKEDMALWLDCTRDDSGQSVLPFFKADRAGRDRILSPPPTNNLCPPSDTKPQTWLGHAVMARKAVEENRTCAPGRNRTCDPRLRRPLLYPLSYWRIKPLRGERIRTSDFLLPKQAL